MVSNRSTTPPTLNRSSSFYNKFNTYSEYEFPSLSAAPMKYLEFYFGKLDPM